MLYACLYVSLDTHSTLRVPCVLSKLNYTQCPVPKEIKIQTDRDRLTDRERFYPLKIDKILGQVAGTTDD